jgi:hypothetical protein
MQPVQAVWIQEYADGDWETVHCQGDVIRTWRYDAEGLTSVEELPELDRTSAIASTTPVISFCVDETGGRMIYHQWHGVRAGHGCILACTKDGKWAAAKCGWKS